MIKIRNISKSFQDKKVLDNISFDIPENGIFAFCGNSGSGKTTLMRILCNLEKADSGTVEGLDGKKISVVFQENRLLPWFSALENVKCVCGEKMAKDILTKVGLGNDFNKKPNELSGGMCRRVAIARALAFKSDILFLDEPLKGLDNKIKLKIIELIKDYAKTRPVVLITHNADEILLAKNSITIK